MLIMPVTETVPLAIDATGVIRVGGTRVTLDTIILAFLEGNLAEEIQEQYPSLQLADIYSVLGYYLRHRSEVDDYLRSRSNLAVTVQQRIEATDNPVGLRDRLLARQMNH
ncbi:DUF433 domain-containing protein [Limnothrix sp. FACHB-708]|uniref:DUF433 domain-containing protein n=1 Tax=unclassified Limnothrix TaxID=2632864 RepID=UPI00167FF6DF|nr:MULTISPECIES: DUF433 domain-containing protein [unclassified Limnothrix]MBD2160184.1 DUF433 domain-containing protein [Limnothrix sp. FACHB-1083]MBD2190887.1 DUF433 domain-containing protein [Limnothrix sp. FACHB-1088]MBD2552449.1 DUF433 domain-containing protein [Limnothrix sp. FACHB-708]MBD2590315.1 DUF433 domain-containing protein [Limnothrix sp. FACHB-406]